MSAVNKVLCRLWILMLVLAWSSAVWACDLCEVVVEVLDGDTVVIMQQGKVRKVHLVSVDAPQLKQRFGEQARTYTEEMLLNRVVTVEYVKKHQASDIVSFDGKSLKWGLVRAGLAWYPKNHEKGKLRRISDPLGKQERKIRRKRIGLWADASPTPPWLVHRGAEALPDVVNSLGTCSIGSPSIIG